MIACFDQGDELYEMSDEIINMFSLVYFTILGIVFIFLGYYLKKQLRLWNEEVERQARHKIMFAAGILAGPFIVRGTFMILEFTVDLNEILDHSIRANTWLAPIIYFSYITVADILPMTSQLATMLVVVDEEDFGGGVKNSTIKGTEGKRDSYGFCKYLARSQIWRLLIPCYIKVIYNHFIKVNNYV